MQRNPSEMKDMIKHFIQIVSKSSPMIDKLLEIMSNSKHLAGTPEKAEVIQKYCDIFHLNKKCEELHEMNFSGNMLLKQVLCFFPFLNRDGSTTPDIEFQRMENMLFSNELNTVADKVYICQIKIHKKHFEDLIPILVQVVSEEITNPMSVVIWHEDFDSIVDDNVKAEIHKSSTKCIVVPSVVYALFLLASVHESLGNIDAYSETMKRFETLCHYFGNDSPISKILFDYASHRSCDSYCWDIELD